MELVNRLKKSLWYAKAPLSFHSMTIDRDDIEIAEKYLDNTVPRSSGTVSEYEQRFNRWNGSEASFAFMSGRESLSACIHAAGLEDGSEAIIPGYTCVVVPNAFEYAGVNIKHADIELETFGIDADSLREKISDDTDAVLLQHLFGLVCRDYEEILETAAKHDAVVIEDCAHSTGATYKNKRVGTRGDLAFYSSEKSKVFSTIQGGMASTNRDDFRRRLAQYYRNSPQPDQDLIRKQLFNVILNYNRFKSPFRRITGPVVDLRHRSKDITSTTQAEMDGTKPDNYGQRMPDSVAALGINQLEKIDYYNDKRRKNADRWESWASDEGYTIPTVIDDSEPIFLRYPVLVDPSRKQDTSWVERQLGFRPGDWFAGKYHPVDVSLPDCPNADEAVRRCINLPCLFPDDRYDDS